MVDIKRQEHAMRSGSYEHESERMFDNERVERMILDFPSDRG
jgi:hypothetical protein